MCVGKTEGNTEEFLGRSRAPCAPTRPGYPAFGIATRSERRRLRAALEFRRGLGLIRESGSFCCVGVAVLVQLHLADPVVCLRRMI